MSLQEILNLSVAEKIILVEKLWDSIAEDASTMPLPAWKKKLLDERIAEHEKDPNAGMTWEELKKKYYSA